MELHKPCFTTNEAKKLCEVAGQEFPPPPAPFDMVENKEQKTFGKFQIP